MDQSAGEYELFVRSRTPALLRCAYLLTGDQHLAEDLVQTALARTHRAWSRLHESSNAEAYTRKVIYHLQVTWWRRPKIAETLPGVIPERGGGGDPGERVASRAALRQALLRLTPNQRAVLVLRFFEDRSEAETAEVLGVSIGTVKSQTSRALERIRKVAPELADLYLTGGGR